MEPLVFISYRRESGYELAHLVDAELRSRGVRTFMDVSESDPGRFWPQIKAAIQSCRALVLICTNGTFEARSGDDWVLREVTEATGMGRPIVPVFSQDFKRPKGLRPLMAQAIEYNGVSMDTQFHIAAFDHLSNLVGGRKRSEQRRRTTVLAGLASLALLAALALGGREIVRLTEEIGVERDTRQKADVRSEQLAQGLKVLEATNAEIRRATLERDRLADEQARSIAALSKLQEENRRAVEERDRLARAQAEKRERDRMEAERNSAIARRMNEDSRQWFASVEARRRAEDDRRNCDSRCDRRQSDCESRNSKNKDPCRETQRQCREDCADALRRALR